MADPAATINFPMPILTPRLTLRPIRPGDEDIVHEAKYESWAELHPWAVWTWGPREAMTPAENEPFCRRKQELFAARADMTLLAFDRETGRLIGSAGLHKFDWETRSCTLGFWTRSGAAGQGYATEGAAALAHYAFRELRIGTLLTCHHDGNGGSRRVIEKLGFRRDAARDGTADLNGRKLGEYWYGIPDARSLPALYVSWPAPPDAAVRPPASSPR